MSNENETIEALFKISEGALKAMNQALFKTQEEGPHAGLEFIADYINARDAIDEDEDPELDDDWLMRWEVQRKTDTPTLESAVAWCEENGITPQVTYRIAGTGIQFRCELLSITYGTVVSLILTDYLPTFRAALIAAVEQAKGAAKI